MSDWQPIETAPKGKNVLLFGEGWDEPCLGHWSNVYETWLVLDEELVKYVCREMSNDGFEHCFELESTPTHWMPVPKAP